MAIPGSELVNLLHCSKVDKILRHTQLLTFWDTSNLTWWYSFVLKLLLQAQCGLKYKSSPTHVSKCDTEVFFLIPYHSSKNATPPTHTHTIICMHTTTVTHARAHKRIHTIICMHTTTVTHARAHIRIHTHTHTHTHTTQCKKPS